jgi:queuine tRNA-ribosyltransferase
MSEPCSQRQSAAAPTSLSLPHGGVRLPAFLPDATRGVVRALDASDAVQCQVQALQMNVFHLMQRPGSSVVKTCGGLHRLFGWDRPIVTDSGGFQVYSLIRQNPDYGQLTERGMIFRPDGRRRINLTPEKSIQLQVAYGADVVICLDDCTDVDEPLPTQRESVGRTVKWAARCKREFEHQVEQRGLSPDSTPLLLAVIQGGGHRDLRKECAAALLEMGFDGYGLGGWPLDSEGNLLLEIIAYTRELVPQRWPMHALGVGQPANVVACARLGYGLFDSTMPTRDARHGRLYVFDQDPAKSALTENWYSYLYIQDAEHIRAKGPLSAHCDCLCCSRYSRAYLHHLFRVSDPLFYRLATVHNLRFMTQLMQRLRHVLWEA